MNYANDNGHERFSELCALAGTGSLTETERLDLEEHTRTCAECRRERLRYSLLERDGLPYLAETYAVAGSQDGEDAAFAERVMRRVNGQKPAKKLPWLWPVAGTIAACALFGAGYSINRPNQQPRTVVSATVSPKPQDRTQFHPDSALSGQLADRTSELARLQADSTQLRVAMEQLKSEMQAQSQRAAELGVSLNSTTEAKARLEEKLGAATAERDGLYARLQSAGALYQTSQAELQNARAEVKRIVAERDQAALRIASVQKQRDDLLARSRDQEHRLDQSEEYLSRDSDIRELMGARQLYMADVFDVSGNSQTRNPYGRIFYTKERSLIFYAFDLDRQQGAQKASFQAWGRTESSQGPPVNLGILYQDNQQNRRWVLRFNDARQLARIDQIFVTVEPQGGSQKPTGKRFLFASLRREPNHP